MKTDFLKNNKGFSLIECIISIAIFAIMSVIVFMILANALKQREINEAAIKTKNEQINANVNGGSTPDGFDDSFSFGFVKNGGIDEVASMGGVLAQYDDVSGIFSITKPDLDLSVFEYSLLTGNGHIIPAGRAFYSTLPLANVIISETINPENLTEWKVTINYNSVGSGFITYFKVPGGKINGITDVSNASVHSFTHRASETEVTAYIRISKLENGAGSAEFTVTMEDITPAYIGLQSWFGTGGVANTITLMREGETSVYIPV